MFTVEAFDGVVVRTDRIVALASGISRDTGNELLDLALVAFEIPLAVFEVVLIVKCPVTGCAIWRRRSGSNMPPLIRALGRGC
jgi:hypothetical protein